MTYFWFIGSFYILALIYLAWEVNTCENYSDSWPNGQLNEGDVERILERSRRLKS